jgi:hypothetical protein
MQPSGDFKDWTEKFIDEVEPSLTLMLSDLSALSTDDMDWALDHGIEFVPTKQGPAADTDGQDEELGSMCNATTYCLSLIVRLFLSYR